MADAEDDRTVRVKPGRPPPPPSARRSLALPIAGLGVAGLAIAGASYLALDHRATPAGEAVARGAPPVPLVPPADATARARDGLGAAAPPQPSRIMAPADTPPPPPSPPAAMTEGVPGSAPPPPLVPAAPLAPVEAAAPPAPAKAAASQQLAMLTAPAPPQPVPPPAIEPVPLAPFMAADEATIREHRAPVLTVFRFLANQQILVLDYPGLHEQARALNRIAALIEKAGLPRDSVVTDSELADFERSTHQDDDGFYYGHDYRVSDMMRFFALADAEGLKLHDEERQVRQLIETAVPPAQRDHAALISIPNPDARVDPSMRAVILHHELSHGEYFTQPRYADYVKRFWMHELSEAERGGFRRFLASEGYDAGDEDLMMNEMQAYLMHTPDPRFFQGAAAGLSNHRTAELQGLFYAGMPPGWLRDCTAPGRTRPP